MVSAPKPLNLATALIQNQAGEVLLVRKRDTVAFMQPGGKIDAGETALMALVREVWEELNLPSNAGDWGYRGQFSAVAANETGVKICADLFSFAYLVDSATLSPASEIAELAWVNPQHTGLMPLAPLTRDHVLPLAIRGGGHGLVMPREIPKS